MAKPGHRSLRPPLTSPDPVRTLYQLGELAHATCDLNPVDNVAELLLPHTCATRRLAGHDRLWQRAERRSP